MIGRPVRDPRTDVPGVGPLSFTDGLLRRARFGKKSDTLAVKIEARRQGV
jgi:hypothetical protein